MITQLSEFDALKAQIQVFIAPTTTLTVPDMAANAIAAGTLKTIKTLEDQIEARRTAYVRPLNEEVKRVNDYAKDIAKPLLEAKAFVKQRMAEFADQERLRADAERQKIEAAQREEARLAAVARQKIEDEAKARRAEEERAAERAAAEEAERIADRRREEAEARKLFGIKADEAQRSRAASEAEEVRKRLESQKAAAAAQADVDHRAAVARHEQEQLAREQARRAQVAMLEASQPKNVRQDATWEVVDATLVPKEYWIIDTVALGKVVRGGARDIPGVKVTLQTNVIAR